MPLLNGLTQKSPNARGPPFFLHKVRGLDWKGSPLLFTLPFVSLCHVLCICERTEPYSALASWAWATHMAP